MVTCPSTNLAQRWLTSFMQPTTIPTKPKRHLTAGIGKSLWMMLYCGNRWQVWKWLCVGCWVSRVPRHQQSILPFVFSTRWYCAREISPKPRESGFNCSLSHNLRKTFCFFAGCCCRCLQEIQYMIVLNPCSNAFLFLDIFLLYSRLWNTWKQGWCLKVLESELLGPWKSWNFYARQQELL